jgi:hypothetical protein
MIFTTVLQWSIFVASKNDLDDQNLLLATVLLKSGPSQREIIATPLNSISTECERITILVSLST